MNVEDKIELFVLKGALLRQERDDVLPTPAVRTTAEDDQAIRAAVTQFSRDIRDNATQMAEHYSSSIC